MFWADLKGGRRKKRSIPRMKTRCGKVVDEPAEVVEELAKHWEELGKCTYWDVAGSTRSPEVSAKGKGFRARWYSQ